MWTYWHVCRYRLAHGCGPDKPPTPTPRAVSSTLQREALTPIYDKTKWVFQTWSKHGSISSCWNSLCFVSDDLTRLFSCKGHVRWAFTKLILNINVCTTLIGLQLWRCGQVFCCWSTTTIDCFLLIWHYLESLWLLFCLCGLRNLDLICCGTGIGAFIVWFW